MKKHSPLSMVMGLLLIVTNFVYAQPSGFFIIPTASIKIDGKSSDWDYIEPVFIDEVNDENPDFDFSGTDIHKFYLAKDENYLYIMMTFYDGPPDENVLTAYNFQANQSSTIYDTLGDRGTAALISRDSNYVWVYERPSDDSLIHISTYPSEYVGYDDNFIEWKVPLSDMGNLNNKFVRVFNCIDCGGDRYPSDDNLIEIQILDIAADETNQLRVETRIPSTVRPSRNYPFWLIYGNNSGSNIQAPLFLISNDANAKMRLSDSEPFKEGPVQVLGACLDGPAGLLPSGHLYSLPIYFNVPQDLPGHTLINFKVEQMTADSTPIDWSSIEAELHPDEIDDDAWDVVWSNLKLQMGNTWAEYLQTLDDAATYISKYRRAMKGSMVGSQLTINQYNDTFTYDVSVLLQFEYAKASARISPRSVLAVGHDVYVPAPGLPLSIRRFAPQSIEKRFHQGPFGRGWTHTFEYKSIIEETGEIIIKGPGGYERVFQILDDGKYQGSVGDYGTISFEGEILLLQEKDGKIWGFSSSGNLLFIEEPNGNKLSLSYTGNNLIRITHSNGERIVLEYDNNGRITQVTDPAGRTIQYSYDASNEHLIEVEKPGGITTLYAYHESDKTSSANALISVTLPDKTHYNYVYNSRGRLIEECREEYHKCLTYSYDEQGTVAITDAYDNTSLIRFGAKGEILQIQDPLGMLTQFSFDDKSQVTEVVGPDGKAVSMAYDAKGNISGMLNPLNHVFQMNYEPDKNRLTKLVDTRSNETELVYDGAGNLTGITYPDLNEESFVYNETGNVSTYTNRRNNSISYTYNTRGQIIRKVYPDGRTIDYQFDTNGNLTAGMDSLTGTITMQYDNRDFLIRIDYPDGYWFTFDYNDAGRRTIRISHDGQEIHYDYDSAGRLERLTNGSGAEIVRYQYDENGRLVHEFKGNGTQTIYEYDATGQLLHLINYSPEGVIQSRFDYAYDIYGNRLSMTTLDGIYYFEYDDIGQIVSATYPDDRQIIYQYDAAGNRISVTKNEALSVYNTNNMNQYTHAGNAAYAYDADGNLISKIDSQGTTIYEYDAENRLINVVTPSNDAWSYSYDVLGNRISINSNGSITRYIHDPTGPSDVAAEYDKNGVLISSFTHGLGLVAQSDGLGTQAYYSFDGIGHTRQLTDSTGVVLNTYDYSPFGTPIEVDQAIQNPFRFVGRFGVMTEPNGLLFMRARFYDAETGRFSTKDPIGLQGGVNLYKYAFNNPISFIDPLGLKTARELILQSFQDAITSNPILNPIPESTESRLIIIEEFANLILDNTPNSLLNRIIDRFTDMPNTGLWNLAREGLPSITDYANLTISLLEKYDKYPNLGTIPISGSISVGSRRTEVIRSGDPNEKVGPIENCIEPDKELTYIIYFENKPTATAPAQEIFINDYLDTHLDWSTFQLGEVAFGDMIVNTFAGNQRGEARVILEDIAVDITAEFSNTTGLVNWTLRSIDLETGEPPENAMAGFLPPEDGSGQGQGYVTFRIQSPESLSEDSSIANFATIVFDTETSITTNEVTNIISEACQNEDGGGSGGGGCFITIVSP